MPSSDTQFKKGNKLGRKFQKGHSSPNPRYWLGKKLSRKHKKAISKGHIGLFRGDKNPAWKGGISLLEARIRRSFKYRQWRSDVFTRDNYICQECGYEKGGILEAHHIKPFAVIIAEYNIKTLEEALVCEELWNINNGITFCKFCHRKINT